MQQKSEQYVCVERCVHFAVWTNSRRQCMIKEVTLCHWQLHTYIHTHTSIPYKHAHTALKHAHTDIHKHTHSRKRAEGHATGAAKSWSPSTLWQRSLKSVPARQLNTGSTANTRLEHACMCTERCGRVLSNQNHKNILYEPMKTWDMSEDQDQ